MPLLSNNTVSMGSFAAIRILDTLQKKRVEAKLQISEAAQNRLLACKVSCHTSKRRNEQERSSVETKFLEMLLNRLVPGWGAKLLCPPWT